MPDKTFEDWLTALDARGYDRGYGGEPLSVQPGADYLRPFWAAGMTPDEWIDGDQDVP